MQGFEILDFSYLRGNEWVVYRIAKHPEIPEGAKIAYTPENFWYWINTIEKGNVSFEMRKGFFGPDDALNDLLSLLAQDQVLHLRPKLERLTEAEKRRQHNEKVLKAYKIRPKNK